MIQNPDKYDKLFVKCNGSAASFVDSSWAQTAKTITANGNATQLPIKFNKSAGFFNGTTDYVIVPDSNDFDVNDFTVEVFVNSTTWAVTAGGENRYIFGKGSHTVAGALTMYVGTNGKVTIGVDNSFDIGDIVLSLNTWYHLMLIRSGATATLYINGVADASLSDNGAITSATNLHIGARTGSVDGYFSGWMKEFRFSNNARTAAVPTAQYVSDANTKLLMHFDTPATSPLGPAIYFDGTGDQLTVPNGGSFDVGTGDFCIDASLYVPAGLADTTYYLWVQGTAGASLLVSVSLGATNACSVYLNNSQKLAVSMGFRTNSWNVIRVQRSGGNLRIFRDGVQIGTVGDSTNITASSAVDVIICPPPLSGYLRDLRFTTTAQDSNAAYAPSQNGFTIDAGTKLYIKGDQNNGTSGTSILDYSPLGKTVTCVADAKIKFYEDFRSCIFKDETGKLPYPQGSAKVDFFAIGSGVGYFDGAAACGIYSADSADWDSTASEPLTLECYIRFKTIAGCYIFSRVSGNFVIYWTASGNNFTWGLTGEVVTGSQLPIANTWYHLACVKEDNTSNKSKIYLNGTQLGQGTLSNAVSLATALWIGQYGDNSNNFDGLMDNIRFSKGTARYTATFNPPTDFPVNSGFMPIFV